MEVMEDGNLMDKVNILIQRDMEYYKSKQAVLQETICPGIIGGRLDFPRSASFAAIKLVIWWEDEYVAAYKKPSGFFQKSLEDPKSTLSEDTSNDIAKTSDPAKFLTAVGKSAEQLLEHLHKLTQEALDHADLTVLTGTIGATALLKNCLWFYIQSLSAVDKTSYVDLIQKGFKKYDEMCEALAERLLDLHCRLLSLYILQDADCLDWENQKAFFETERGSYVIQMWWIYMLGTKEDLWNTVPPKMAQRVFSGMLNESLTILTVRYTQSLPSKARSELFLADINNLLLCVAQLLPSVCDSVEEFIGSTASENSKILRDIHVKCHHLFCCFLIRGASLDSLHKIFKKTPENIEVLKQNTNEIAPWIVYSLTNGVFQSYCRPIKNLCDINDNTCLTLDLIVLLAQPQPNWALLLKVLCAKKFHITNLLLTLFLESSGNLEMQNTKEKNSDCGNFLCTLDGSCKNINTLSSTLNEKHYCDLIMAVTEILLYVGNDQELNDILIGAIMKQNKWEQCFERQHLWNQIRFPWFEAILDLVSPILPHVVHTTLKALQTGATMYQAMSLIIACLRHFWDMLNPCLIRIATLLQEILPSDITPVNNSVLMQIVICGVYTKLLETSQKDSAKKEVSFEGTLKHSGELKKNNTIENMAIAAAESLCSIDEDNKHTDQIEDFLEQVNYTLQAVKFFSDSGSQRIEHNKEMAELVVSDLLMSAQGKKCLKTLFHFIKHNSEWLFAKLEVNEKAGIIPANRAIASPQPLIYQMFHIGCKPFDQLLTKEINPNWLKLLQNPLGLSLERVWTHISSRWEFRDGISPELSTHDIAIVNELTTILKL